MSSATPRTQHLYVNKFPYNFQNEKVALDESAIDVLNMLSPTVVVIVVCLAAWLSRVSLMMMMIHLHKILVAATPSNCSIYILIFN